MVVSAASCLAFRENAKLMCGMLAFSFIVVFMFMFVVFHRASVKTFGVVLPTLSAFGEKRETAGTTDSLGEAKDGDGLLGVVSVKKRQLVVCKRRFGFPGRGLALILLFC